jgi:plastocyanin
MGDVLGTTWTKWLARMVIALAALAWGIAPARADGTIAVQLNALEPPVLRAMTGERVDFVNRTGRLVHVQFAADGRQHEVVQIPGTATIWVVFHRPGEHPYEVHVVVDGRERTLRGLVEVAEGAPRAVDPSACGVTVMGVCIER